MASERQYGLPPHSECDRYPCDHTGCDCDGTFHNPGPNCPGQEWTLHELRIWPEHFEEVWRRRKTFEARSTQDRTFKVNDELWLREFDPEPESYTGRSINATVTHLIDGPGWGISEGHAVLSFRIKEMTNARL